MVLPFMPELGEMIVHRLTTSQTSDPVNESMWVYARALFPQGWQTMRYAAVLIALVAVALGGVYKRLNGLEASALLSFILINLSMTSGSPDRHMMSITFALVILGIRRPRLAVIAGAVLWLCGLLMISQLEMVFSHLRVIVPYCYSVLGLFTLLLVAYRKAPDASIPATAAGTDADDPARKGKRKRRRK
jgi:hypothetical protein